MDNEYINKIFENNDLKLIIYEYVIFVPKTKKKIT